MYVYIYIYIYIYIYLKFGAFLAADLLGPWSWSRALFLSLRPSSSLLPCLLLAPLLFSSSPPSFPLFLSCSLSPSPSSPLPSSLFLSPSPHSHRLPLTPPARAGRARLLARAFRRRGRPPVLLQSKQTTQTITCK